MFKKEICKGCKIKTSQYHYGDELSCLGCIPTEFRKGAMHKRMEHQILNEFNS